MQNQICFLALQQLVRLYSVTMRKRMCMWLCMYISRNMCMCCREYLFAYVCMWVYVYVCAYVFVCMNSCKYVCMYLCIHVYVCTYLSLSWGGALSSMLLYVLWLIVSFVVCWSNNAWILDQNPTTANVRNNILLKN